MQSVTIENKVFDQYISVDRIAETVSLLAQKISGDYVDLNPIFIPILNGAYVFAADLIREISIPSEVAFVKLASYEAMQSSGTVKIIQDIDRNIEGRHIIIVEDIVDTGLTLSWFTRHIEQYKPASVSIAALLQKPAKLQVDLAVDYVGILIPDAFVLGYGMDCNEQGRNLPAIYQLREV